MNRTPKLWPCTCCGNTRHIVRGWGSRFNPNADVLCAWCVPKKPSAPLKATKPMKKRSAKRDEVVDMDKKVNEEIWAERPHVCFECGVCLGGPPLPHYFSHVLAKGKHVTMRHHKPNIVLHCWDCHNCWDFGKRALMPKTAALYEVLLPSSHQGIDKC